VRNAGTAVLLVAGATLLARAAIAWVDYTGFTISLLLWK
jgi:hypothetical protein